MERRVIVATRNIEALLAHWIDNVDDPELAQELAHLAQEGAVAASDAFFQDLAFGTAGLRGIIGAGTNRMNIYTVARATQGLADYLNAHYKQACVALARDSRNKGELFIRTAACVLAANGITSLVYPRVEPTPALSFAVRHLACSAGINMTASHNPAAYSGYKVYDSNGCQITSEAAHEISEHINKLSYFPDTCATDKSSPRTMPYEEAVEAGLIAPIDDEVLTCFIDAVAMQSCSHGSERSRVHGETHDDISIVYTPLNGTGLECVSAIFEHIGLSKVSIVPEQAQADGNFPTCTYPNPEERAALERGIALCKRLDAQGLPPDLLLATDPDADRVGVACKDGNDYVLLNGNEIGVLLLDFIARHRVACGEDLSRALAVTTIVSSTMVDEIARNYGFEVRRTLTGFKYIGEQIGLLEAAGESKRFIFGFEESYGYLAGTHVRDKDAVVASMLICELARECRKHNTNLVGAMNKLYERYGWHLSRTLSLSYPGADGSTTMKNLMTQLRSNAPHKLAGYVVKQVIDYADGVAMPCVGSTTFDVYRHKLPVADVLEFCLEGSAKLIIRPSGTEPKIKAYVFANAHSRSAAETFLDDLEHAARELLT